MADSKISDLPAITSLSAGDEFVVAASGVTNKITAANASASFGGIGAVQPIGVRVPVDPYQGDSAQTNWNNVLPPGTISGQSLATRESSGAQNAEVTFKVVLAAGTWKLHLFTFTLTSAGIYTVSLDAVSQGTIDGYSAVNTVDVLKTLTGIVATTDGIHDLNFKMATKNGSSSSYFGDLQDVLLERTA